MAGSWTSLVHPQNETPKTFQLPSTALITLSHMSMQKKGLSGPEGLGGEEYFFASPGVLKGCVWDLIGRNWNTFNLNHLLKH